VSGAASATMDGDRAAEGAFSVLLVCSQRAGGVGWIGRSRHAAAGARPSAPARRPVRVPSAALTGAGKGAPG